MHARRGPGAGKLAEPERLQLRPGAAVVGRTGQERLGVRGHGVGSVALHVYQHQQLAVVEPLHVDRLLPDAGSGRQRVPPVGGMLEPRPPGRRRSGRPVHADVADLRLSEQVRAYRAGAAVGAVARLEAAVIADAHDEPVALQGDHAPHPDAVGTRHARDHRQPDELEVAGAVHLRQRDPEVLRARRLPAVGKMDEIEVGLVAGAQDDAGIAVAAQQEVEADPTVLAGAGAVEREVRSLQGTDLGIRQIGRNRQRAVGAVRPGAVDEVPAAAVADGKGPGGKGRSRGHERSVRQAAAQVRGPFSADAYLGGASPNPARPESLY